MFRRQADDRDAGLRLVRRPSRVGYHCPRRIRLVAYGARLERGLG